MGDIVDDIKRCSGGGEDNVALGKLSSSLKSATIF